jgi:Protein of unknown function (DUF4197)
MNVSRIFVAGLALVAAGAGAVHAAGLGGLLDTLRGLGGSDQTQGTGIETLTQGEIADGLKQALEQGVSAAVTQLGKPGGFLDNARVRIPMPKQLAWAEKTLRGLGQDKLADDFLNSMNSAAEKAVPEVASLFGGAIKDMTVDDAEHILKGSDDAATQYFRSHTSDALVERMRPIVAQATDAAGVTASYKSMMSKAGGLTSLLGQDAVDLDGYITDRAMDGLFLMIADEEKKIRANPVERSTELLKKVFANGSS